jgi:hypothetical protein
MFRSLSLLILAGCLLSLCGCKKSGNTAPTNASAILGKWLHTEQRIRIYTTSGVLVRDTTNAFGVIVPGVNSYQTFNKDGSGATINNTDTVSVYTYTISGSIIKTYFDPTNDSYEVQNILVLNATNLELEAILISSNQAAVWGLDPTVTYKLVEDDYYTKQ